MSTDNDAWWKAPLTPRKALIAFFGSMVVCAPFFYAREVYQTLRTIYEAEQPAYPIFWEWTALHTLGQKRTQPPHAYKGGINVYQSFLQWASREAYERALAKIPEGDAQRAVIWNAYEGHMLLEPLKAQGWKGADAEYACKHFIDKFIELGESSRTTYVNKASKQFLRIHYFYYIAQLVTNNNYCADYIAENNLTLWRVFISSYQDYMSIDFGYYKNGINNDLYGYQPFVSASIIINNSLDIVQGISPIICRNIVRKANKMKDEVHFPERKDKETYDTFLKRLAKAESHCPLTKP